MALIDSRKAWAANIAIEWLPCRSIIIEGQTVDYINIESENQKSILHAHLKIILSEVLHRAPKLFIYLSSFFFLLSL